MDSDVSRLGLMGEEQHYKKCPMHEDYPEPRNRLAECICTDIEEIISRCQAGMAR